MKRQNCYEAMSRAIAKAAVHWALVWEKKACWWWVADQKKKVTKEVKPCPFCNHEEKHGKEFVLNYNMWVVSTFMDRSITDREKVKGFVTTANPLKEIWKCMAIIDRKIFKCWHCLEAISTVLFRTSYTRPTTRQFCHPNLWWKDTWRRNVPGRV